MTRKAWKGVLLLLAVLAVGASGIGQAEAAKRLQLGSWNPGSGWYVYAAAMAKMSTPKLTRALIAAVEKQGPPRHGLFRPKLRYAHQGGSNPPIIVIHGNALEHIPASYTRYLERYFLDVFKLTGTPLRVQYKSTKNPYADSAKVGAGGTAGKNRLH